MRRIFYLVVEAFTKFDVLAVEYLFAAGLSAVPLICAIPLAFLMWLSASRKSPDTQQLVSQLVRNGEIIVGKVEKTENNRIKLTYISPTSGKEEDAKWHTARLHNFLPDDNVILLYLNDNCVIVL